jgi:hypothetical protein
MSDVPPEERVFDRIPSPPSRSADYPMRTLTEGKPIRSYSHRYVQLDQGREGACVAFDSTMEAAARPRPFYGDPVRNPPDIATLNGYALEMYELCRDFDQRRYPEGATQLSGMRVGVKLGFWKGYRWATGTPAEQARDVMVAIRLGPVCFASDWHQGMDRRDPDGFLQPTGTVRGGHSYLLSAVSAPGMWVWTPNSWGGAGQGRISYNGLVTLFDGGAEAAIPDVRLLQKR